MRHELSSHGVLFFINWVSLTCVDRDDDCLIGATEETTPVRVLAVDTKSALRLVTYY